MDLYKALKKRNLVIDEKEYTHLIYNRQIKVNDERIDDPKMKLNPSENYQVVVGLKEINV